MGRLEGQVKKETKADSLNSKAKLVMGRLEGQIKKETKGDGLNSKAKLVMGRLEGQVKKEAKADSSNSKAKLVMGCLEGQVKKETKGDSWAEQLSKLTYEDGLDDNLNIPKRPLLGEDCCDDSKLDSDTNGTPQQNMHSLLKLVVYLILCFLSLLQEVNVMRRFKGEYATILPLHHSDRISLSAVRRTETEVGRHFFSSKSASHTPEKFLSLRNKRITKCLENPSTSRHLVSNTSRIIRYLVFYAVGRVHHGLRIAVLLLRVDPNTGDLQLVTLLLKWNASLMLVDKPKFSLNPKDLNSGELQLMTVQLKRNIEAHVPLDLWKIGYLKIFIFLKYPWLESRIHMLLSRI